MPTSDATYCIECGNELVEDTSPGVWLHADTDDEHGYDIDADHVGIPETEDYAVQPPKPATAATLNGRPVPRRVRAAAPTLGGRPVSARRSAPKAATAASGNELPKTVPFGRVADVLAPRPDADRIATVPGSGMFADLTVRRWPSREAMIQFLEKPNNSAWRALQKDKVHPTMHLYHTYQVADSGTPVPKSATAAAERYELFYGDGGHGGPYQTIEEAEEAGRQYLRGMQSVHYVYVVPYSKMLNDPIKNHVRRITRKDLDAKPATASRRVRATVETFGTNLKFTPRTRDGYPTVYTTEVLLPGRKQAATFRIAPENPRTDDGRWRIDYLGTMGAIYEAIQDGGREYASPAEAAQALSKLLKDPAQKIVASTQQVRADNYGQQRDQYLQVMQQEGVPPEIAKKVLMLANQIQRFAVKECNEQTTDQEKAQDDRMAQKVTDLLAPYRVTPDFSGDPRGAVVKLRLPSGKANDFGGTGMYCVPTQYI